MILIERSPSEIQIQADAWKTIWKEFKELRRCFFHVPNESAFDNSQQSSSGVVPGIQDMFLLCAGRAWLIELKDDKGRLSRAQKVVHSIHKIQGFDTYVFRTSSDTIEFVRDVINEGFDFVKIKWAGFVSEASDASKYEVYLADYQANKQKNRAAKSKK